MELTHVNTKGELECRLGQHYEEGSGQLRIVGEMGSFDSDRSVFADFSINRQKYVNGDQMLAIPLRRDRPCITMIFQFGGLSAYNDKYNPYLLPTHHHSINYFNRFDCTSLVDEKGIQHEVNMVLEESFYSDIVERIAEGGNKISEQALNRVEFNTINDRQPMDAGIYGVLQNILNCPFDGTLKETYLRSQITALMHLQFWHFNARATGHAIRDSKITQRDVATLHAVKEFIDNNFLDHATVLTLSRRFGINEFKLKYGFRQLFNSSPIKYVLDRRLTHAAMLLRSTDSSVSEIARISGYNHPNNFTIAFRRQFGMAPQQYRAGNGVQPHALS